MKAKLVGNPQLRTEFEKETVTVFFKLEIQQLSTFIESQFR